MHKVITTIISYAQSDVIPGRRLGDNIVLVQELDKGYNKKYISPKTMIKIDLQKVYDSLEWIYLEHVMHEVGFFETYL